jgi:hypothetical protein
MSYKECLLNSNKLVIHMPLMNFLERSDAVNADMAG